MSKPTVQTAKCLVFHWYAEYLMNNPVASVNRSKHMNAFGTNIGELFPKLEGWPRNPAFNPKNKHSNANAAINDIRFLLATFIGRIDWNQIQGVTKIDVLHLLTEHLKKFFKELVEEHEEKLDADHCAAFLVDFVNFVGMRMGVDYGLYTGDITHELKKS
jgi:hypothetical protein